MDNQRLMTFLYNAIVMLEEMTLEPEIIIEEMGMTEEEYNEIMGR